MAATANEAKRIASKLVDDPLYRLHLLKRLRNGEAGAIEVWLWRWRLGDPPRAEQATEEEDKRRFEELRAEVFRALKSGEGAVLEAQLLGPAPRRRRALVARTDPDPGPGDDPESPDA